jgi:hypothetical protein
MISKDQDNEVMKLLNKLILANCTNIEILQSLLTHLNG